MQHNTDLRLEAMYDDHPYADVLTDYEKALYLSAVHDVAVAAADLPEDYKIHVEFESESPELKETTDQVGAALAILELIGEVTKERRDNLLTDSDLTQMEEND